VIFIFTLCYAGSQVIASEDKVMPSGEKRDRCLSRDGVRRISTPQSQAIDLHRNHHTFVLLCFVTAHTFHIRFQISALTKNSATPLFQSYV
jgi:hypothetical protein